jgi:hypothetical protein
MEGEAVLLNLNSGRYFGLDPVGARVWHLLVAGNTNDETVHQLVREYDVTAEQAAKDVARLLTDLQYHELLETADG